MIIRVIQRMGHEDFLRGWLDLSQVGAVAVRRERVWREILDPLDLSVMVADSEHEFGHVTFAAGGGVVVLWDEATKAAWGRWFEIRGEQ